MNDVNDDIVVMNEDDGSVDRKESGSLDNPPEPPKHKAPFPKRVDITLDMSDEDVLHYDEDGGNLFWDGSLEGMKLLEDETVKKLSSINRERYFSSLQEYTTAFSRKDDGPRVGNRIEVSPRLARATQRLEVTGKRPGIHYCWKRSDEVNHAKVEGYKAVSDPAVETFMGEGSEVRKVGADGYTELVLMEIPDSLHQERQRAISEKSKRRIEGVDNQTKEDIRRSGGIPYEGGEGPGGPNFSPSA